mgnify:CR=1 FL=1
MRAILNLNNKKYIWCLLIIAVTYFLMLVTFNYSDTSIFEVWSCDFWDAVFSGKLQNFYDINILNRHGNIYSINMACGESWLKMLPMALWDLPIWIIHYLSGHPNVNGFYEIIWHKSLFIVASLVAAIYIYKICLGFSTAKSCWCGKRTNPCSSVK